MKIRDISLGCLFLTFSCFPAVFAWTMANKPNFLEFAGIYGCIIISSILFSFGKHLIVGIEVDDNEE